MNDPFFSNKIAVITGAGGTLCSAIARHLSAQGVKVALLGRTPASLEQVAADIRAAGGTVVTVVCDVTDPASVERACATVVAGLGVPWFLINGAGGNQAEAITTSNCFDPAEIAADKPAELRGFFNLDPAKVEDVIRTNTLGTILPSQVFGREMARLGRGSIVNFGSMNSYRPLSRVPAYAMAKAGVVNFTQWLAVYLAPAGVRVNAVAPGFFVNERSRKILMAPDGALTARGQNVMAHTPLKRFGESEELVGTMFWLLDDTRAGFVTGVTVPVDGGFLAAAGI